MSYQPPTALRFECRTPAVQAQAQAALDAGGSIQSYIGRGECWMTGEGYFVAPGGAGTIGKVIGAVSTVLASAIGGPAAGAAVAGANAYANAEHADRTLGLRKDAVAQFAALRVLELRRQQAALRARTLARRPAPSSTPAPAAPLTLSAWLKGLFHG